MKKESRQVAGILLFAASPLAGLPFAFLLNSPLLFILAWGAAMFAAWFIFYSEPG